MVKKTKKSKPVLTIKKAETKDTPLGQGPASQKPLEEPKPEFEQALKNLVEGASNPAADSEEKVERRGGARPGAGRPKGVTDDFASVNKLPEKANLTLVPVLQIPFATWAKAIGVKELALSKEDAKELALPVTQLLEFYFPGRIPEIAWVWLMMLGTAYRILEPRLDLLAKIRKEKVSVPFGSGPVTVRPPGRSRTGAADPATEYPKDG